jgi:hypothetical protein
MYAPKLTRTLACLQSCGSIIKLTHWYVQCNEDYFTMIALEVKNEDHTGPAILLISKGVGRHLVKVQLAFLTKSFRSSIYESRINTDS